MGNACRTVIANDATTSPISPAVVLIGQSRLERNSKLEKVVTTFCGRSVSLETYFPQNRLYSCFRF
jgi:hypothetical protein